MTQTIEEKKTGSDTAHKWVYLFREGNAQMRELLGGKGAGVAEMTRAGMPVPPGFTITTETCNEYYRLGQEYPGGLFEQIQHGLRDVEQATGKGFGDAGNPLLVSVRSGAKFSMPGMMDTVLNLGLNDETAEGLARLTENRRFALDAYRRFIQMYGKIVLDIDPAKFEHALEERKAQAAVTVDAGLPAEALEQVVEAFKDIIRRETGALFPTDPREQLKGAVSAVFRSWNSDRAKAYRAFNKIPDDLGTGVNVQAMVFGNMGDDSGTGVAFTRNPSTGESKLYGEYLLNAQGEDVVAGIRTPQPISTLERDMPEAYRQFQEIARRLEKHYKDMQDLEFTIERGTLYMLQTRAGKRTAAAAVKVATDMVREGLIDEQTAIMRVEPNQVVQLLLPRFDQKAKDEAIAAGKLLAKGLNASPGAATGKAVFDADTAAELGKTEPAILVRPETSPDDVHGMIEARGILTARGGATSHAAVVARGMGKPCVAGTESLRIDVAAKTMTSSDSSHVIKQGDFISIDGSTGEVFVGEIATVESDFAREIDLQQILSWADGIRRLQVWANGDYPRDAQRAREYGAQGIGLCRTEHMFFETERLPVVQAMILSADEATRVLHRVRQLEQAGEAIDKIEAAKQEVEKSEAVQTYLEALAKLEALQKGDFKGILAAMRDLPVVIRLIDPPLHEFLPSLEDLLVEVTTLRVTGENASELKEKEELLAAVERMHEQNPMLGLRGIRLGILYPEIIDMQTRAIIAAAAELTDQGVHVKPEIMVPLVGTVNEMKVARERIQAAINGVLKGRTGRAVEYKIGTMIEVPRAALTAGEIAAQAEFFSFGTNDLSQTTYGYSRDDAEGKFLLRYVDMKILPTNPFQELDRQGVGRLMEIAVTEGRQARPDLEVGICGEHGGDPSSIEFCNSIGLNYVSCSPFRVPVARLAAAQAVLSGTERDR
ncbi:MAG TPA: pyruvate, phosphate dikinase [Chloroflexota bacterium]|jgi:pyruvate,orthophosphate dikinase|nr:pyruvate, phosphate dikinase [Chloroflexota bacterium]